MKERDEDGRVVQGPTRGVHDVTNPTSTAVQVVGLVLQTQATGGGRGTVTLADTDPWQTIQLIARQVLGFADRKVGTIISEIVVITTRVYIDVKVLSGEDGFSCTEVAVPQVSRTRVSTRRTFFQEKYPFTRLLVNVKHKT